jgi:hypothetical protein
MSATRSSKVHEPPQKVSSRLRGNTPVVFLPAEPIDADRPGNLIHVGGTVGFPDRRRLLMTVSVLRLRKSNLIRFQLFDPVHGELGHDFILTL